MASLSAKITARHLTEICVQKEIRYAVISPGSRNAPLTISLCQHEAITCLNIPDERVAAFFALGMAQQLESPAILCCTSGSAGLNYAPALVEAYYQKIPLLVLTADRPPEWIDQRAGQTMRQAGMFQNFIKASYRLFCDPTDQDEIWYNDRIINQAIDQSMYDGPGPVHINIPFREPLYQFEIGKQAELQNPKLVTTLQRTNQVHKNVEEQLCIEWGNHQSVMIIVGQHLQSTEFDDALLQFSKLEHTIILTESTSNVSVQGTFKSIDRLIDSLREEDYDAFAPDLIVSCGGPIVSKKLRHMLRRMSIKSHWHVDADDGYMDTYQALTLNIPMRLEELAPIIINCNVPSKDINWKERWSKRERITLVRHQQYLEKCVWSDLKVIDTIHQSVPEGIWHAANSTPVRYTQLFETRSDLIYRSNRGVSGIDGCTSTAMGAAYCTDQIVTLITGDIAFFYDSNAFWHHHGPDNLRVFMLNNEGGNIFRYIPGPMDTDQFEEHFEAHHRTSAEGIAMAYGVTYRSAQDENELENVIQEVFSPDFNQCVIVEILTPRERNIEILKEYFSRLGQD